MKAACPLADWLEARRQSCQLSVQAIPWCDSAAWRFTQGRLEHVTGGFFTVVGVRATSSIAGLDGLAQPIIDQPEIGILGFIVRAGKGGHKWLVQAKAEPGNVGVVQLAPSVQATYSNFTRLHGGAPTAYLDYFTAPDRNGRLVASSLQSEHGNRFLGKYNRNMAVLVDGEGPEPCSADWCWTDSADVRAMLEVDFAVNTDARSVLLCCDWGLLADGVPFERWRGNGGWGARLLQSFEADPEQTDADVLEWLERQRAGVRLEVQTCPLESMADWVVTSDAIVDRRSDLPLVGAYAVQANSREVDHWDQPFVLSHREESVVQICQRRGGVLHFLLRASVETGFRERVQLGPSWQSDDLTVGHGVAERVEAVFQQGRERHSTLQSDEGGRFFRSTCRYRIVELPEAVSQDLAAAGYLWLSLGQIGRLARIQGVFTNEARSGLSMLLAEL